jgi:hypothetical protein
VENKPTKVLISAADGRIEFEGSEEFVERQLKDFGDVLKEALTAAATPKFNAGRSGSGLPAAGSAAGVVGGAAGGGVATAQTPAGEGLKGLENLFAEADGRIQILKNLPGSNITEKMILAARLLAYAIWKTGKTTTSFREIGELCKAHGCYDSKNLARRIKGEKSDFVVGGKGKTQYLSLSVPGRTATEAQIAELLT